MLIDWGVNWLNIKAFKIKIMSIILLMLTTLIILQINIFLPNRIILSEGEEYTYNIYSPLKVYAKVDKSGVLNLNGEMVDSNRTLKTKKPLTIKAEQNGCFNLELKLLGLIPIRTVNINVEPKISVIPCGNTIGVKLYTDGILIIGTSEFTTIYGRRGQPWIKAEIKEGDIIDRVEGEKITNINDLIKKVDNSDGKELNISIIRKGKKIDTKIIPEKDIENKKYKLGLWVRDSTAGIGTLTFIEPETGYFGALGHGITDIDTGELLTISKGEILKSNIISVQKGLKGKPGELKGVFMQEATSLGEILRNNERGIYGKITTKLTDVPQPIIVGTGHQIEEGPAYILSNIKGEKVEKFDIEIQKVMKHNNLNGKGLIIKIIDNKLLELTGGIVQGMSGSPIIQNEKIIGAITHVFVNDPTKGYGILLEWMLDNTA